MNKRQAKKIMLRYKITGNKPVIYTKYQIQTAFNIEYPKKDRTLIPGIITAIGVNDFTYTVNYAVKAKSRRIKMNIQIDDSPEPPHGLVAGLIQPIYLPRYDENDTDFKKRLTMPLPQGKWRGPDWKS